MGNDGSNRTQTASAAPLLIRTNRVVNGNTESDIAEASSHKS